MKSWYQLETSQVLQKLESNTSTGLSSEESQRRLKQYGWNELAQQPPKALWKILLEQFTSTTVMVLIVAGVISGILGEYKDAGAIGAIVILNAILGFSQEYQAGKAFAALEKLAIPKVRVYREGMWQEILSRQLVPGDIIRLEAGDIMPADGRLWETSSLRVQEATFTGESEPVEKHTGSIARADLPYSDRRNMIYMGTMATYGRGGAVVTETGMQTELGKIADLLQSVEQELTPLQQRLNNLGSRLATIAIGLAGIIFVMGLLRGESVYELIIIAVSMAVAIIPEGLPAVITITLSLGARRMLKQQTLIRKLPAVETLGSVTVICSDKTGTLTENCMTVTDLEVYGQRTTFKDLLAEELPSPSCNTAFHLTLATSVLCNDALLLDTQENNKAIGDPTEIALVVAAAQLGLHKTNLEQVFPRVAEIPFDSDRKCMTTIHQTNSSNHLSFPVYLLSTPYIAFTKGAVDKLLALATHVWNSDHIEALNTTERQKITAGMNQLATTGTRVLGVAFRSLHELPDDSTLYQVEEDLVFLGIVGMMDPARVEVFSAVQICQQAGIRPIMITGDHPLTAQHIAHTLGISGKHQPLLTGQDLEQLSLQDLEQQVESISVYARVSPEQKLKIVEALQNRGHVVGMMGDGVNDAPALKKAQIGVAMGVTGTDVAKEAADMVLLDDNFTTMVMAVEQGRVIYDNIRKFIRYTLTGNASGVWIMLLAPLLVMPLPLRPLQILWINLLADGLLALSLSVEPAEKNVMKRPPYNRNESIFGRGVGRDIIWVGLVVGLAILGMGYWYWSSNNTSWQTMVFVTLAFSRISLALAMRTERDSLFTIGLLGNKAILVAVVLTFGLQLAVIYLPWLQAFFQTTPLSAQDLTISLVLSTIGFWSIELEKKILSK